MEIILLSNHASKRLLWKQQLQKEAIMTLNIIEGSAEGTLSAVKEVTLGCILWDAEGLVLEGELIQRIRGFQRDGFSVFGIFPKDNLSLKEMAIENWCHVFDDCLSESEWNFEEIQKLLLNPRKALDIQESFQTVKKETVFQSIRSKYLLRRQLETGINHLKICTWGESGFSYELGAYFSGALGKRTLVIDGDRLNPTSDLYLNVSPLIKHTYESYTTTQSTGLNILIDSQKRGSMSQGIIDKVCQPVKGFKNYFVLTGCYNLKDFEYYTKEEFSKLIAGVASYFDVLIIKVNPYAYDGFSAIGRLVCDVNFAAYPGTAEHLRQFSQLIHFMQNTQGETLNKSYFVEYSEFGQKSMSALSLKMVAENFLIGKIQRQKFSRVTDTLSLNGLKPLSGPLEKAYATVVSEWKRRQTIL